jgi:hypothetical protein
VPEARGKPVFIDVNTAAICSTRCGFAVDVVDLRDGRTIASWMPWWWVPYLMIACMVGYAFWAWAWLNHSATAHNYPMLDVAIVIGIIVGAFALRCRWIGIGGIDDSALEQSIRGIGCAVSTLSLCGLFFGKGNPIARFLVLCFVLAGVGAISRLLLDSTYIDTNDGMLAGSASLNQLRA